LSDASGGILDRTAHEFANLLEAAECEAPPVWRAEYTFTPAWRVSRRANLTHLYTTTEDVLVQIPSGVEPGVLVGEMGRRQPTGNPCLSRATSRVLSPGYRQCYCSRLK
jgi:hypothetical protein